jgi:hypothetical protein
VDDAVSDGDNTVTSGSATNLTSECKHKDGPRCLRKSKAGFCVPGCWGKEMTSLQTVNTYDVNTENSHSKESELLETQGFHSSANCNVNIIVTSTDHSLVSHVHKYRYCGQLYGHITIPSQYQQCAVCGKSVQKLNLHMKMHTGGKPYERPICSQRFLQKGSLEEHNTLHTGEQL